MNDSLKENIRKVEEFHHAFNLTFQNSPTAVVGMEICRLRHRLMQEENDEYLEACEKGDLNQIADALGDKMYILFGTIIAHGLQHKIEAIFREIHQSNMSKLDANGKPIYREDGKVLKSEKYFLPDINKILCE